VNTGFYIFINKKQECILIIDTNSGFPSHLIQILKDTVTLKRQKRNNTQTQRKTRVNFTYHSPLIRNVPNLFKHTNVSIAYRATNNLFNKLQNLQETQNKSHTSGIYKLTWITCNSSYGTQGRMVDNS
jgi:molybdopterin-biosynthesis enzyme MoeA-like protein